MANQTAAQEAMKQAAKHLQSQLWAVDRVERSCSILSVIGCVFTIVTFSISKAFRRPINRMVFYASWGNQVANVTTLMSRAYINDPNSVGCQTQAFLLQTYGC